MSTVADWASVARAGDPPADRAIARIVGPWPGRGDQPSDEGMRRLALATRLMGEWTTNGSLAGWSPVVAKDDAPVVAALREYLDESLALPAWADPARIELGEKVFMDYGPLSCTLLFCASLPECYVLPHLAQVLHAAGQLEAHTEHRIRQTAAMVFPVMMQGGLVTPAGGGVAQVLKVRLIHATIRHLILHGPPETAPARIAAAPAGPRHGQVHRAMVAMGWDVQARGVPCSQLELAYTLLTFHFVFLRGMRQLGIPLSAAEEEAFLHTWNVAGHVLGIRDDLMPHDMAQAQAMFEGIQAHARAHAVEPDVRPGLGRALMDAMAASIGVPVIRSLPVPMTRWLVGPRVAGEVGIDERVGFLTWVLFRVGLVATRVFDAIVRLVLPQFSLTRMFTRVVGYHLLTRFLLDQTRPLNLPDELLAPVHATIAGWHHDDDAPGWVNRLEDRLTAAGPWQPPLAARPPAGPIPPLDLEEAPPHEPAR